MIIVLQSLPRDLMAVRTLLQTRIGNERVEQMVFTGSHRTTLEHIQLQRNNPERTIVISSGVFYGDHANDHAGRAFDPGIFARFIKTLDPEAWVFLYTMTDMKVPDMDGSIPKWDVENHAYLLEFLSLDFSQVSSLGELYEKFSWLKGRETQA